MTMPDSERVQAGGPEYEYRTAVVPANVHPSPYCEICGFQVDQATVVSAERTLALRPDRMVVSVTACSPCVQAAGSSELVWLLGVVAGKASKKLDFHETAYRHKRQKR